MSSPKTLQNLKTLRPFWPCLALLGIMMLSSCAGGGGSLFSQPDPAKNYFALQAQRPTMACATGDSGVLKVRRMRIAPTYASRELVYRLGPEKYATDYYNVFLVSPQDMLSEAVLEWFSGSGLFSHVVPGTSSLQPDYVLESSATRLYGDYSKPGQALAVLEIQFFLLQDVMADYKVIMCRDYVQEVSLQDRSPQGLVAGLQQAMLTVFKELEQDVAGAVSASTKKNANQ